MDIRRQPILVVILSFQESTSALIGVNVHP